MNIIVIGIAIVIVIIGIIVLKNKTNNHNNNNNNNNKEFNLNDYFSPRQQMNMVLPRTYQNSNHVCVTWQDWNTKMWFVFIRMNASGRTFQYNSDNFDGHVKTIAWATQQASQNLLAQ